MEQARGKKKRGRPAPGNAKRLERAVRGELKRIGQLPEAVFSDPRGQRGRCWELWELLTGLFVGALVGAKHLREVSALTEGLDCRIPKSTLWDLLLGLKVDTANMRRHLVGDVRGAVRAKEIVSSVRDRQVAIDGKTLLCREQYIPIYGQERHDADGKIRYHVRSMRAVLVSGGPRLCIGQQLIPAAQNEISTFAEFWETLLQDYGADWFGLVSLDAGYASLDNAARIDKAQVGYLIALKDNQPELLREGQRLLAHRTQPDAVASWEHYKGKRIRRLLFRTADIAGYLDWTHLRQVWRVRQETDDHGKITVEERYFITNLTVGMSQGDKPLPMVRNHWGIENGCHWTLDTVWEEDSHPWASAAVAVMAWLRVFAYNFAVRLRTRHLRSATNRERPWRDILNLIKAALNAVGFDWLHRLSCAARPESEKAIPN